MRAILKLQMRTFFTNPLTYLVSFLLFPILLALVSSLFSFNATLIGIIVAAIVANIFFVFIPNYIETKNSVLFKRIQTSNLSKASFIFITAILCLIGTVGSTYLMIYVIDYANGFYAFFFTGDITDSLIKTKYTFFFINDLFSILDDAVGVALFEDGSYLHEFVEHNIIHEIINNDLSSGTMTPEEIADDVFSQVPMLGNNQLIVNNVLDIVFSYLDPNYGAYLDQQPTIGGIDGLAGLINFYNGVGIFNSLSKNAMETMSNNDSHAPVNIITYVFIGNGQTSNPDAIIKYPIEQQNGEYFSKIILDGRYIDGFTDRTYSSLGVINEHTLMGPVGDSGGLNPDGTHTFETHSRLNRIIGFALTMCMATFSIFSIGFLIASISKSFTQYSYIAIVVAFLILLFSGSLLPMAVVFSSPITYFVANFMPTTNLIIFGRALSFGIAAVPLMSEFSTLGYIVIPMAISTLMLVIGSVFYSMNEGKFTKRFEFSKTGKTGIIVVLIAITMFELFLSGRVIQAYDNMDSGVIQHNSNYFLLNFLFIYLGIFLFVFFLLYLKGFSNRSIKGKHTMPIVAVIFISIFIGYIFISNKETEYALILNLVLIISAILVIIFGFTYRVVKRGLIE